MMPLLRDEGWVVVAHHRRPRPGGHSYRRLELIYPAVYETGDGSVAFAFGVTGDGTPMTHPAAARAMEDVCSRLYMPGTRFAIEVSCAWDVETLDVESPAWGDTP